MSHISDCRKILVSSARIKLQQDRGASIMWLQEGCGVVCESAKLGSGSDRQDTLLRVLARFYTFWTTCTYICIMKIAAQ